MIHSLCFAQPLGLDMPINFRFRFYDKGGNIITPKNESYVVKISFEPHPSNNNDSVVYSNGYYTCISNPGAIIRIQYIFGEDTMEVHTSTSLDSVPFIKGKFIIPKGFSQLNSIKPKNGVIINSQNWVTFKVNDFNAIIYSDTLKRIKCKFWGNHETKAPLIRGPNIYGILYNPDYSTEMYAWDWDSSLVFVSHDKGRNWHKILKLKEHYFNPVLNFKNKDTLILFVRKVTDELIYDVTSEVYLSYNGGKTWEIDPILTQMEVYFAGFNDKHEGFAYSSKYFGKNNNDIRTTLYIKRNQKEKWKKTSSWVGSIDTPRHIQYWENDTIALDFTFSCSYSSYFYTFGSYISYNGGRTWKISSDQFQYISFISEYYPSIYKKGDDNPFYTKDEYDLYLKRINNKSQTHLLTIIDEPYISFTAKQNIWCLSGHGFTMISKDYGQNWSYFSTSTLGTNIFTIIDDKYIFNGTAMFEIN